MRVGRTSVQRALAVRKEGCRPRGRPTYVPVRVSGQMPVSSFRVRGGQEGSRGCPAGRRAGALQAPGCWCAGLQEQKAKCVRQPSIPASACRGPAGEAGGSEARVWPAHDLALHPPSMAFPLCLWGAPRGAGGRPGWGGQPPVPEVSPVGQRVPPAGSLLLARGWGSNNGARGRRALAVGAATGNPRAEKSVRLQSPKGWCAQSLELLAILLHWEGNP